MYFLQLVKMFIGTKVKMFIKISQRMNKLKVSVIIPVITVLTT